MDEYTYQYNWRAPLDVNASESMKMDKQRAALGPSSEQLRAHIRFYTETAVGACAAASKDGSAPVEAEPDVRG